MTWSESGYQAVAQFVGQHTGLALSSRRDAIEGGIRRAMARARAAKLDGYLQLLASNSNALDDLVVELTVGETYFFREPRQFEFLRREVLPPLRRRCETGHTIRAWSAGCASGEEAYTLAMLLEQEGLASQAHVLGTDISRAALARAHRAVYGAWSLRGEDRLAALPYLTKSGAQYRVEENIRRRVTFDYLNLALDVYPSLATGTWSMDLILCRNVLIYLDQETIQRVAQRLYAALAEGGWLLTASSDPPLDGAAPFEVIVAQEGVFYRKQEPEVRGQKPEARSQEFESTVESLETELSEDISALVPDAESRTPDPSPLTPDEAFARGDYHRVVELTREWTETTAALHVQALANLETAEAERACAAAAEQFPLSVQLHYLHAVLLLELGRDEEAVRAARRVIYLDRSLALAHFTLGSILKRRGNLAGARRAYRNARNLCLASPAGLALPLAEGEHAGRLAEAAAAQLALIDAERKTR